MKVLMMHRSDGDVSGAQVQMNRIRNGMKERGINANILCRERTSHESILMPYRPRAERWIRKFTQRIGLNDIHLVSSASVSSQKEYEDSDVLDIHCFHSGTFSYLSLPALTSRKATVFTFHDMWPFTGHCHASLECNRWKTGCGKCPHLDIQPPVQRDGTAIEWILKNWVYGRSKFTIVTPSKWLHDQVKESMLRNFPVHIIPHGVDTEVFKPLPKDSCQVKLNIPLGKKVLLCAMETMQRPLKGIDLLVEALGQLPQDLRNDCVLLFFGQSNSDIIKQIKIPVIELGYLHDDRAKAEAYSAADVFIQPSRAESFGLVALESIACGTPVIAFGVGGLTEVVRHGITGIIARPEDPRDLSEQVVQYFRQDHTLRTAMSNRCRNIAKREYSIHLQVERYITLYRKLIADNDKMLQ
jgi:glycosyltransferase involved in cell wall biosynthesis